MRSALGAKVLPGTDLDIDVVIDNIWVVETLDADDIDREGDKIDLPRDALRAIDNLMGTSNVMPQFANEDVTLDSLLIDGAAADDSVYKMVVRDAVGDIVEDELGNPKMRYFIAIAMARSSDGGVMVPQVIELTVVEIDDDNTPRPEESATSFDFLTLGAWAIRPGSMQVPTALGNGYLIADPAMITSVANMPMRGRAIYEGRYVSYIESRVRGQITDVDGVVEMTANFGRGTMKVELRELFAENDDLTLNGTITGNTFAGTGLDEFDGGDFLRIRRRHGQDEWRFLRAGGSRGRRRL